MKKQLDVIKVGALSIQVCTNYKTKKLIEREANKAEMCGTENGWILYEKESRKLKQGVVDCAERKGFKHYILYA